MEYLELKNMEYLELSNLDNIELSNMEYLKLSNMDYLELPDGSSSYLHSLKSRKTLWEINNEPQMYEVEILHENNEDFDTNFDDILNMNRVHCSICNLDVPKTHIKQHNKTTIHQNLMKLTDEVLERTKRHLKTNEGQTNASLNVTDTFFCEICSKLIQNNNINDHMESKFHKKQELFEKLLNLFIETYLRVNEEVEFDLEDIQVFIDSNESSLLKHRTLGYPNNISKDLSQNLRETHVSKVPSDIAKARSQSPRERPVSKVPSDIAKAQSQSPRERPVSKVPSDIAKARSQSPCERPVSKVPSDIAKARSQSPREKPVSKVPSDIAKARSQSTCERPVSKVPSDISKDPSEIENPCETPVSKVPSDTTKDPVINIFDPNYLKELLESGKNESSSAESQIWKIVKKRSLSTSRTSVDTSKKDTTSGQDDVSKDTKKTKILIKTINKAERKREQQIKNIKAFEEFSSYIKTIQDKYPSKGFKIEAVTSLKVKITALNGDCVLVSRNHFQSNDGKYCRVCQNGNLSADHEMSEEHISRIMVPVVDKNCIREIDDIWSHCIICNILIKFVEDHNRTALHLRKLKKSFIDIPKQPVENKPKTIISEEKGNHIQHTEKENEEEKRVNTQEKKATFKFDIDKFSNTLADKLLPLFAKYAKTKEDANENNHNGTSEPDNRNTVEVAKEINEVKQLKESIQTMVDQDYKSLTEVPQFDDEEASNTSNTSKYIIKYCSICRTHVHDYEAHKLSNTHTENNNRTKELRKMITRNNLKEIKDLDLLNCEMCDVNINFNTEDTEEHVNSQLHKCNYFKFIRYNKIILIDQIESQCEPCNKAIHRSNIFDHCKQEKHIKKLKDLIHITSNQTKPNQTKKELKTKTTDNKIIQNDDVKKLLYHYRAQDVEFLCKICHALISRDAAKGHSESKQHKEKYNTLLNSNKIIKTITGSFYCELCDVQIPMTGEITHVFGKNHIDNSILKAKVAKNESNAAILIKAIVNPVAGPSTAPVPSTSKEIPIKGKLEMNVPLYVKYQYKVPSEGLPICLICEKKVRNSDITNHVLSTTHNINFNLMMINNTIKIKGNMYICVCCNTSVPLFGELEHILGKLHSKNKINLPIASVGTDMLTYDHVLNLTQGKRMVKY